jgi:hydrogenase small subunit
MANESLEKESIAHSLKKAGCSRRDFLQLCTTLVAAAPMGLALTANATPAEVARKIGKARKPSVIWLEFQDCTGCSESLLRTTKPDAADLILNIISLDYHETLMAASGLQAQQALAAAVKENAGKFVLVCEGAIPTKEQGNYLMLAGRPGVEVLKEVGSQAAAIIAMGSCASWGGVPSASPNPTGSSGVDQIITGKPIVNIPGCPPNPYNLLGVVLEYAVMGKLPACDELKRPKFAYDRLIHDHCPRRAHFDAGEFANAYGDEGHRLGYCLYKLGCKGPVTHSRCSVKQFNEVVDAWPVGEGSPCFGCTEKAVGFNVPLFQRVDLHSLTAAPPDTYAPIFTPEGHVSAVATGVAGLIGGALAGAGYMASRKLDQAEQSAKPEKE